MKYLSDQYILSVLKLIYDQINEIEMYSVNNDDLLEHEIMKLRKTAERIEIMLSEEEK